MTHIEHDRFTVSTPTDLEIVITRRFRAPRALVFATMTQPEHLPSWWGTPGLSLVSCNANPVPGGHYRIVFLAPNGGQFAFSGQYRELDPPARLVRTFEFEGMPERNAVETLTFTEQSGETTLTMASRYETKDARDAILAGMEYGAAQAFERLAAYLADLEA